MSGLRGCLPVYVCLMAGASAEYTVTNIDQPNKQCARRYPHHAPPPYSSRPSPQQMPVHESEAAPADEPDELEFPTDNVLVGAVGTCFILDHNTRAPAHVCI